jgi:hypothetical protein
MPTPRADIAALEIHATPSNLKRAKLLRVLKPEAEITDPEILEKLLADAAAQYELAITDVNTRGYTVEADRYSAKGKHYTIEQINPSFRVATKLATQIMNLKVLLAKIAAKPKPNVIPGSAADLWPEMFETEKVS